MKKYIIASLLILIVFINTGFSERLAWTTFSVNLFSHHDANYKDIYGDFLISPEIKLNVDVFSGIYLWGSVLFVPASWESEEYSITAESNQLFVSIGFGDQLNFTEKIKGVFELGFMYMVFKEDVSGDSVSGSDFGFRISTGINYKLSRSIYACSMISYLKGASSIGDKEIKLGGLKASVGIEITLFNKKEE